MTEAEYFNLRGYLLYPGQSEVYRGQCVQSVMIKIKSVDGIEPPVYPNAKDYWYKGIPGYQKVSSPQTGDIAVYDGHGAYQEGHIAVVSPRPPEVFEQNADPDGSPMHFYTRKSPYLLGYLRKEEATTMGKPDRAQVINYFKGFAVAGAGGQVGVPTEDQIKYYTERTYDVVLNDVLNDVWNRLQLAGKPTRAQVLDFFKTYLAKTDLTDEQIKYYTDRSWSVLASEIAKALKDQGGSITKAQVLEYITKNTK